MPRKIGKSIKRKNAKPMVKAKKPSKTNALMDAIKPVKLKKKKPTAMPTDPMMGMKEGF